MDINLKGDIGILHNFSNIAEILKVRTGISYTPEEILENTNKDSEILYYDDILLESPENLAILKCVPTNFKFKDSEDIIYLSFKRELGDTKWHGCRIGTLEYILDNVDDIKKTGVIFNNCDEFFNRLLNIMQDKSNWTNEQIIKYLKNLYTCIKEDKKDSNSYFKFNKDKTQVAFNSRLMDKWGNFILIGLSYKKEVASDPYLISLDSLAETKGFDKQVYLLEPYQFFNTLDEIMFCGEVKDFDLYDSYRLKHIIDDRRHRLSDSTKNLPDIEISMKIKNSIEYGVKMSKIDYKFVVPIYDFETSTIQFLLPFYDMLGTEAKPSAALVISRKGTSYSIRTIIPIEDAFWNSKLICPSFISNWLSL